MERTLDIYRVNHYQSYEMAAIGIYFSLYEPIDTIYYKHEYEKITIIFPDEFNLWEDKTGEYHISYKNYYDVYIDENKQGIFFAIPELEKKIYIQEVSRV